MASFTDQEKELLPQFRKRVADIVKPKHDDHVLVKWLRARRHDVDKAEEMYRKSMKWREDNRVDYILEEFKSPEVMLKYYPGGICGQDKEGRPIWVDPMGRMDCKGLMHSVKKSDIIRHIVYRLEVLYKHLDEISQREGRRVDQVIHLLDLESFGMKHLWKPATDLYLELVDVMESNYPEILKTSYIINAPKIFYVAYRFLKQFLPEDTQKKFVVFEKDRWQETVFKEVDRSQLPVYYSGTRVGDDGDEMCKSLICYAGDVPEHYYVDKMTFFPENVKLRHEKIGAGSTLKVEYDIKETNVGLRYMFGTEGGHILFALYRKTTQEKQKTRDMECLVEPYKVNCHLVPEDGTSICDKPGTYVLVFDNSKSYFYKRKLTYYVEEIMNDGHAEGVLSSRTESSTVADLDKLKTATATGETNGEGNHVKDSSVDL